MKCDRRDEATSLDGFQRSSGSGVRAIAFSGYWLIYQNQLGSIAGEVKVRTR